MSLGLFEFYCVCCNCRRCHSVRCVCGPRRDCNGGECRSDSRRGDRRRFDDGDDGS